MEQKYGNLTIGEINEMLISFIGKDMYLSFWEQANPKESIKAYKKRLNRLLKEEDSDLSPLSLSDDKSVAKFVFETILPKLQDNYSLSNNICDFIHNFVDALYNRFATNETPILDYCLNFDNFDITNYLEQAKQKYNEAFSKIQSITDFCRKFPNEETIENNLNAMKSGKGNPTWSIMEQILNQVKEDKLITSLLIDAHILSNIYDTLNDRIQRDTIIDPQFVATDLINNGIQFFFVDYGYNKDERKATDILKLIEQSGTPAHEFYCNWFRGFQSVAKGELKQAKDYYKKAFAARRFAGCQFEKFIKQAFALSCYDDFNADKVRDSADSKRDSTSPLSTDAKKYWNYGYVVGIFDRKAEETHLITFYRVEHLLSYFGSELYPENLEFYKELLEQQMLSMGCRVRSDEKAFKEEFDRLSNLTSKDINKRSRLFGSHPTKNPIITLAIFYILECYSFDYYELAIQFINMVKSWLDKYNDLNFDLCSDKGSTIACDAIQQYKVLKLHHPDLNLNDLKQIILTIIEKSNVESLTKKSLKLMRCALQEAIESCDLDIVEAVVEKFDNIGTLSISADEVSPVYYAIHRYVYLYRHKNGIVLKPGEIAEEAMKYENLDVPGLTKEEKIRWMNALENQGGEELVNVANKMVIWQSYGKEEIWESELNWIKDICLYLIEHTNDQDGYFMKTKDGAITSLLFAIESNNVAICRALIQHKANPHINKQSSFLHKCIYWNSWNVLAMYMEEFGVDAKQDIINDNNSSNNPLLEFLKKETILKKDMDNDYFYRIIELFKKYGATFNPIIFMMH